MALTIKNISSISNRILKNSQKRVAVCHRGEVPKLILQDCRIKVSRCFNIQLLIESLRLCLFYVMDVMESKQYLNGIAKPFLMIFTF